LEANHQTQANLGAARGGRSDSPPARGKPHWPTPAGTIGRQSFAAILNLMARLKSMRENQGLTLAEVAARMEIDAPALSRLETGKVLNPTLATLHKWAEALGQKLDVDLSER